MNPIPFVSVIVPCRNEAGYLGPCLDSILESGYPPDRMEVLVADGMSEDGTRDLIRDYQRRDSRVRCINNPHRITPAALNRAIEASRGEVIARVDAHSTVSRGYFSRAVECLAATGAVNVGGVMRTVTRDRGLFAEPIRIALSSRFGVGDSEFRTRSKSDCTEPQPVDTVFGGCWPRHVLARVGGFNERLERSQDIEFNLRLGRAGGKILMIAGMECEYYARATVASFFRHNWINGAWAVLPFAYSPGFPVRWRHLVPLAFVVSLCIASVARCPGLVLGPYLAISSIASAHAAWKLKRALLFPRLPIAFAALHFAYGAGSLWGALQIPLILLRNHLRNDVRNDTDSCAARPVL